MRIVWNGAAALATLIGFNLGVAQAAFAQEAPAAGDEATTDIVVTAQKREQQLSEVPMAITAYGGSFLERLGVTKFDELAAFTPGLRVQEQSANNSGFVVRGITTDSGNAQEEPRVAIFQDGVSASRNRGSYVELFDLERVEIAKGPQATLFGRAALIGGINIIQKKADLKAFGGNAEVSVEDGYVRGLGVLNAPIVQDKLALRIGATMRERDGWVDNLEGGQALQGAKATAGRAVLTWAPTSDLTFDLILNRHDDDNPGTAFKSGTFIPAGSTISPLSPARLNTSAVGFEDGRTIGLDRHVNSGALLGAWEINDAWTLNSISGWREFHSFETFDPDGSSMPFMMAAEDAQGRQWSQELRLRFDNGGPFSGFFGVSFQRETGSARVPTMIDERYAAALLSGALITTPTRSTPSLAEANAVATGFLTAALTPGLGAAAGPTATALAGSLKSNHYEQYVNASETTSYDVYGDLTWKPTDKLELTAGLRWTVDEKESSASASLLNGPSRLGVLVAALNSPAPTQVALLTALLTPGAPLPAVGLFTQPLAQVSRSGDFDDFTWRLVGRYEFTDNLAGWASYARGRRPEVISLAHANLPGSATSNEVLPAEVVDSYEIGVASTALNGRLRANASAYYYEYENFQTQIIEAGALKNVNAGAATAPGAELQLSLRPLDMLELFGTYAYNHARFDGGARDGNQFRLSPDSSFSLGASLALPLPGFGSVRITPTYTWQSKTFFDDKNDRRDLQPPLLETAPTLRDRVVDEFQDGYGLLNTRVRFEHESGNWAVELFGTNLTDEEYLLDAGNVGDSFTFPTFVAGAPRMLGVSLIGKF